jgi:hypothetical protein
MLGGSERCVGGCAVYGLQTKMMKLQFLKEIKCRDNKQILGVLGERVGVSFDRKSYDDVKGTAPPPADLNQSPKIVEQLKMLAERPYDEVVRSAIDEYELRMPLLLAVSDIIKTVTSAIQATNGGKRIKINPRVAMLVESVWDPLVSSKSSSPYDYDAHALSTDPNGPLELVGWLLSMLDDRGDQHQWGWALAEMPAAPVGDPGAWEAEAAAARAELESAPKKECPCAVPYAYVGAILDLELKLQPHLVALENYYIRVAQETAILGRALDEWLRGYVRSYRARA